MFIMLPAGCGARDLVVRVAEGSVSISLKQYGTGQPLVSGTLSEAIAGSVWSVESGVLSLELEKARPRFWTCALRGDPEVDVQALVAKEKRDQEPPHKLPPDADAIPRQVTDRETLRKLKAEFPQLELPIANAHTATHQNFAGKRSAFEWGALPTEDDQARPSPPPSTTAPATGRRTLSSVRAPMQQAATAQKCVDSQPTDATKYSWGSLPSETAGLGGGGDGMYSWGLCLQMSQHRRHHRVLARCRQLRHRRPCTIHSFPRMQRGCSISSCKMMLLVQARWVLISMQHHFH